MTNPFTLHENRLPAVWTALRDEFWGTTGADDDTWDPRDDETDTLIFRLLDDAQAAGVVTGPGLISFVYCGGENDDSYCFHVSLPIGNDVNSWPWLRLASRWDEMRRIGERDVFGIDAARAVLSEAVYYANEVTSHLTQYIEKQQS